jgi:hypothetical protein
MLQAQNWYGTGVEESRENDTSPHEQEPSSFIGMVVSSEGAMLTSVSLSNLAPTITTNATQALAMRHYQNIITQ